MAKRIITFILLILIAGLAACYKAAQSSRPESNNTIPAAVESSVESSVEPSVLPSHEEIRELLNNIPYSGIDLRWFNAFYNPIALDETGIMIADFISGVNGFWGPPSTSFKSPEEASAIFVFWASFMATNELIWSFPASAERPNNYPELNKLVPYLEQGTYSIILHKHLEETANKLFGFGRKLEILQPQILGVLNTYEFSGVFAYSLRAFGVTMSYIPIVLSYEYIGDGYEVICVFVFNDDSEDRFFGGEGMSNDKLIDYLHTVPGRHRITLKNNPHGGFYYWAHILPND